MVLDGSGTLQRSCINPETRWISRLWLWGACQHPDGTRLKPFPCFQGIRLGLTAKTNMIHHPDRQNNPEKAKTHHGQHSPKQTLVRWHPLFTSPDDQMAHLSGNNKQSKVSKSCRRGLGGSDYEQGISPPISLNWLTHSSIHMRKTSHWSYRGTTASSIIVWRGVEYLFI